MNIQKLYKLYKQHPVITTDSRECPQGSIFIALKGASFNGNKFAKMPLSTKKNMPKKATTALFW